MNWQRNHARVKSGFLTVRRWRKQRLTPLKKQLVQCLLREINSWSTWVDMPPAERLDCWRNGFLSQSAALYDFENYPREQFISDFQREKTAYINPEEFASVLMNKISFYKAMRRFSEHRPETFGVVDQGCFHPIRTVVGTRQELPDGGVRKGPTEEDGHVRESPSARDGPGGGIRWVASSGQQREWEPEESGKREAANWVLDRLRTGEELVLKPAHAAGGKGVKRWSYRDGTVHVNGRPVGTSAVRAELTDLKTNVVMECVEQASYAAELFSGSTNTIRMVTMWDHEHEEACCPAAVHRIGTEHSAPVDNFDSGGLSAQIDLETGELGEGVRLSRNGDIEWFETHPTSGSELTGTRIPGWTEIRDRMLDIADTFSYVPYIGWDIVVTGPGEFVLLEANNCPGVKSLQAHEPLLTDERARRFFAHHGVC